MSTLSDLIAKNNSLREKLLWLRRKIDSLPGLEAVPDHPCSAVEDAEDLLEVEVSTAVVATVEWRKRPPTPAEVTAHASAHPGPLEGGLDGWWLCRERMTSGLPLFAVYHCRTAKGVVYACTVDAVYRTDSVSFIYGTEWTPLSADGPCQWPMIDE